MSELLSRKDAKIQGLIRYFTGKPCKHGHIVEHYVKDGRCVECAKITCRKMYAKNPKKSHERVKDFYQKNPQKAKNYRRKWQNSQQPGSKYNLTRRLRIRLYHALKGTVKIGSAVQDLGCNLEEFRSYIEKQWQSGMNWDNWSFDGWHLDHIKPLSSFDLTKREQFLEACHYSNYQPLWAKDNLRKSKNYFTT